MRTSGCCLSLLAASLMTLAGCDQSYDEDEVDLVPTTPADPEDDDGITDAPGSDRVDNNDPGDGAREGRDGPDDGPPYAGPRFDAEIEVLESMPLQYAASFRVTTPTGGWQLSLDRTDLNGGVLRAYLTLEAPAADEIVTLALVPHEKRFDAGIDEIAAVEVYVNLIRRGVESEPDYRLAARAP